VELTDSTPAGRAYRRRMNPLTLYLLLVGVAVAVCVSAIAFTRGQHRACPACDEDVLLSARACKACGYRFQ
jgi:hypothetical protein